MVEVGGPGTLSRLIAATARYGCISMIGVLSAAQIDPLPILLGGVCVRGIVVGSRAMLEAVVELTRTGALEPVIDSRFPFDRLPDAYAHLRSGRHFGKVVVTGGALAG